MSIGAPSRLIRILLADDTPVIRHLFRRMFTSSGLFEVVGEAADGHQAVEVARREQPDVVLLDLAMPVVDGFDAIAAVAECSPGALIIALSGFDDDTAGEQAMALGAHAYIEKKHRPDELLRQIIEIHRLRTATRLGTAPEAQRASTCAPRRQSDEPTVGRAAGLTTDPRDVAAGEVGSQHDRDHQLPIVRQLETTNAELARSNAGLATFASVAAHDLRSPLHVVVGFSELLAASYADRLDADGRDMISSIVSGAHRMEQMIDGLLADCRLDGVPMSDSEVSLDDVLTAALTSMAGEIQRRHAIVTLEAMPVVVGDAAQLQVLLQNLLSNALKFSADRVVPRIHVAADRTDAGWRISVADNGIGIDPAKRDEIFGMFVRLDSHGEVDGSGIGLASCKRIVEAHEGTIRAEDGPGGGTRFVIELPERRLAPAPGPVSTSVGDPAQRPLDILLVEDRPEHARLIEALLHRAPSPGCNVRHVDTLAEAREVLSAGSFDCVLLDLSLPDAREFEALNQLRSVATTVSIVVITSSPDESMAFAAVSQGAQDYLVKGHIDAEHLSRSIRWAVQRKALENDLTRDALHDPLTALPNRTLMLDRLASALARAERSLKKVVVFFIDLDGFKQVNDGHGHDAGDRVLVAIAERLRNAVRPQDTVARIGGDEFVVICEGFNPADSEWLPLQERLTQAVGVPVEVEGQSFSVNASIGLSVGGRESEPEDMLRDADRAMYAVKRSRR